MSSSYTKPTHNTSSPFSKYNIFSVDPADQVRLTTPAPTPSTPACPECPDCGAGKIKTTEIRLPAGGFHLKASCMKCGRYLKFLPHGPALFHFGRHRGKDVAAVYAEDPGYLEWAVRENVIKGRLRVEAREALQ